MSPKVDDVTAPVPRWRRYLPLLLLAVLLGVYLPSTNHGIVDNDINANSLTSWRIAHTGAPWMEGIYLPPPAHVVYYGPGVDGHTVTFRSPGQIWAAVPFYYLFSDSNQAHFSIRPGGYAAAVMTALAMMLLFLVVRRRVGDLVALGSVGVLALTTPMWSVSADALWTHPVTVLGISFAAWATDRNRWWLAGVGLGVAMTARLDVAFIAAVLGLGLTWVRRDLRPAIGIAVPTVASLVLLAWYGHLVYGVWDPRTGYTGYTYTSLANVVPGVRSQIYPLNLLAFFLAWDRGWLVWTPVLALLLPTVRRGWRDAPDWTKVLAVGGMTYVAIQMAINVYGGGSTFWGYRLALEPMVCVFPLYVMSLKHIGARARTWLPWVTAAQFAMIIYGTFTTPLDVMNLTNAQLTGNSVFLALWHHPLTAAPLMLLAAAAWAGAWFGIEALARRPKAVTGLA